VEWETGKEQRVRTNGYINMIFPLLVHSREKPWERVGIRAGGGQGGEGADRNSENGVRVKNARI